MDVAMDMARSCGPPGRVKPQVRGGAPPGTRTPNPLISEGLLRSSGVAVVRPWSSRFHAGRSARRWRSVVAGWRRFGRVKCGGIRPLDVGRRSAIPSTWQRPTAPCQGAPALGRSVRGDCPLTRCGSPPGGRRDGAGHAPNRRVTPFGLSRRPAWGAGAASAPHAT